VSGPFCNRDCQGKAATVRDSHDFS
jgi:hypothetical protein